MARKQQYFNTMAQDLEHGDVILDPEGNEATVVRYQWVDEDRGRLETDLGLRIMGHREQVQVRR